MTGETDPHRKPRAIAFSESDETRKPSPATSARKPSAILTEVTLTPVAEDPFMAEPAETAATARTARRGASIGKIFLACLAILVSLALGLWVDALIRDLFATLPWLGWLALGAAALAVLALLVLMIREIRGLRRLANIADLRADIAAVGPQVSASRARALSERVASALGARPETARGRAALRELDDEIIDGPHLLAFTERELLSELDRQARALTLNAARRVSVITALSPRAFVDIAYVGFEAFRLIRAMATLYGGRPGTFGMIRLFRDVIAHLAVTGTVAVGDSLIQQVVGHGIAARLSARLGEGVINGLMTARIGISAMDLCRPMPFSALKRPGVGGFLTEIARFTEKKATPEKPE